MFSKDLGIVVALLGIAAAIGFIFVVNGFGSGNVAGAQTIHVSTIAPTVNDDHLRGFSPGDLWVDQTEIALYHAIDVTATAALWKRLSRVYRDEGVDINEQDFINFIGAGITCTDDVGDGETECDVPGGGSGSVVQEGDSTVSASATTLDFGAGFDITDSPANEANIVLDLSEYGVDISDETNLVGGTGVTLTGDTLTIDLGVDIDSTEIVDGTILEVDLKAVDSAVDEECLTFEATTGDFEWQSCGGSIDISDDTNLVAGTGITLTDDTLSVDLGTSIDISDETNLVDGTGITLTDDTLSADLGTSIDSSEISDDSIAPIDMDAVDTEADEECLTYEATGLTWEFQACLFVGGVDVSDDTNLVAGTGITLTGDTLSVDLGIAVDTSEITDGTVLEADLDVSNSPTDNYVLSYNQAGLNFTWVSGGGGGTHPVVLETDTTGTLDISNSTNLAAGTGITLTGDSLSVDLGTSIDSSEIDDDSIAPVDIDAVDTEADEECLSYEATGNTWEFQTCLYAGDVDISDDTNLVAGTGITLTDDTLSVDLGVAVDTSEITDGTVLEADLDVSNSPTDNYVLSYNQAGLNFTWVDGSGGGTHPVVLETDTTGTLDISNSTNLAAGTGITLTGDSLSVDLGVAVDSSEITDDTILEIDLKAVDSPNDEECLTYEVTLGDFEWQSCVGSVDISDDTNLVAGTGITLTGDSLSVDLGVDIDSTEIVDGTILEVDLKAVDSAVDEECLTFESTTGDFEWQSCGGSIDISDDSNLVGGTGITLTDDTLSVDLGVAIDSTEIVDGTILEVDLKAVDSAVDEECLTFEATTGDFEWQSCGGSIDISDDSNLTAGRSLTLTGDDVLADAELYTEIDSWILQDPTAADDALLQDKYPYAITITRISCSTDTGTATIQFDERSETTPNSSGTDVMTGTLVCDSNMEATTSFANAGIAADAVISLDIDAVASTPTIVRIHIDYTFDD